MEFEFALKLHKRSFSRSRFHKFNLFSKLMNDNTFTKAQFMGSVSSKGGAIRAKGSINGSDRVDVYRFTVRAGTAFTLQGSVDVTGGRCNYTTYSKDAVSPLTKRVTFQGSPGNDTINLLFSKSDRKAIWYVKFDKPMGNVDYDLAFKAMAS